MEKTVERYLALMASTHRPRTLNNYRRAVVRLIRYLERRHPKVRSFTQLRRTHIEDFLVHLSTRSRSLSKTTRIQYLINLRRFLTDISEHWQWPDAPPAGLLGAGDVPRRDKTLPKALSPQDDDLLQRHLQAEGGRYSRMLLLLRYTGLRIGELLRLSRECVQHLNGESYALHVPLGKLHNERVIPIEARSVELIEEFRSERLHAPAWKDPESGREIRLLLCWKDGRPIRPDRIREALHSIAKEAGITERVWPHRLRHTYATELVRCGMNLTGVMKLLGHRSLEMTMNYVKVTAEDVNREFYRARSRACDRYATIPVHDHRAIPERLSEPVRAAHDAFEELIAHLQTIRFDDPPPRSGTRIRRLIERLRKAHEEMGAIFGAGGGAEIGR